MAPFLYQRDRLLPGTFPAVWNVVLGKRLAPSSFLTVTNVVIGERHLVTPFDRHGQPYRPRRGQLTLACYRTSSARGYFPSRTSPGLKPESVLAGRSPLDPSSTYSADRMANKPFSGFADRVSAYRRSKPVRRSAEYSADRLKASKNHLGAKRSFRPQGPPADHRLSHWGEPTILPGGQPQPTHSPPVSILASSYTASLQWLPPVYTQLAFQICPTWKKEPLRCAVQLFRPGLSLKGGGWEDPQQIISRR